MRVNRRTARSAPKRAALILGLLTALTVASPPGVARATRAAAGPDRPGSATSDEPAPTPPPLPPDPPTEPDPTAAGPDAAGPQGAGGPTPIAPPFHFAAAAEQPFGSSPRPGRAGVCAVARESIFGDADDGRWRPLPLRTFFREGWDEPWKRPPTGSSGATRQGWIGAADGNFYRLYFFSYNENFDIAQGGNGYADRYVLYTPLSRRFLMITTIPFLNASSPSFNLVTSDFGSSGASTSATVGRQTSFGDITFTPRVMLAESRNLSVAAQMAIQVPTGNTDSGAGRAILTPALHFWSDIGRGWALRGGFNASSGVNKAGVGETLTSQLAIGQTITPHDMPIFGDFTYYLAANVSNQTAPKAMTTVTLGPGYRTHLGNDWYSLGAVTVPVTAPRPYHESITFWIMKVF